MAINKVGSKGVEDGAVAAADFKNADITAAKLNSTLDLSSKTVTLPNTSVTSGQLAGSIANAKLSNSSITASGTSIALGASGTLNNAFIDWQSKVTSDGSTVTTMVAGRGYFVDNSSAAGIVKLPASASIGDIVVIKDYAGNFGTNKLTIQRNSHNIQGVANDSLIGTNRASLVLIYVDATKGWLYTDEHNVADLQNSTFISATGGTVTTSGNFKIHTFTGDSNFVVSSLGNAAGGGAVVDYLVVAGGGGSGCVSDGNSRGGGGGAGGFRESHSTPVSGPYTASPLATSTGITVAATAYPITVGAGGPASCSAPVGNGSQSVFSTITSAGGGHGASHRSGAASGGSGGAGAPGNCSAGSGNTPPVSPSQGFPGGTGTGEGPFPGREGGGGGGALEAGNTDGQTYGGDGAGTNINTATGEPGPGPSRYYSGGGGGGNPSGSHPNKGLGGGGNQGGAGTANTGGGGGGNDGTGGHAGGKGIVIIRYKFQ